MTSLTKYIIRRLLFMIPVLLGVSILTFVVGNLAGNPIALYRISLRNYNPAVEKALIAYYHLDKPVHVRYFIWLWNMLHGDFGVSYTGRRVIDQMLPWIWPTLELQLLALFLALIIGIPIGVYSAKHQYSKMDYFITTFAIFGYSMPSFWLGVMAIIIFSFYLGWLPPSGYSSIGTPWWGSPLLDHIAHLILPVSVLTYISLATIVRLVRGNMLEVLRQDYILAARASGLSERSVLYKHALRNAISPIVTLIGLSFGLALAGAPALETVFSWPGLGYAFVQAASGLDIPLVQGITMVVTVMVLLAILFTDIAYTIVDPRVRLE